MKRELIALMNNPAHRALWGKVREGFREISGRRWETRADYDNFWPLVNNLYKMAHHPRAELPDALKGQLTLMMGNHMGRVRKGRSERPYFHHILMVLYVVWLLDLPLKYQLAAIAHDDIEDVPKHIKAPLEMIELALTHFSGKGTLKIVRDLSNDPSWKGDAKHKGQAGKIATMEFWTAVLKLIDRLCNLYDMRQDRPPGFDSARLRKECRMALNLMAAMKKQAPDYVRVLLVFMIERLCRENNFKLSSI